MEDKQIISAVVDTLTGKVLYEFTIKVRRVEPVEQPVAESIIQPKQTFWDKLFRRAVPVIPEPLPEIIPEPETERKFTIYPAVAINQYRIAGAAVKLPVDLFENPTKMLAYTPEHLPTMIYIVASAIQNDYREPEKELITFLEKNMDNLDIAQALAASLQGANMQAFTTSILLMQGEAMILTNEGSPIDGSE
jgi:hypothetical protein